MFLLIIGCGRSGTTYASKLLLDNGLDVRHERVGRDGIAAGELSARHSKAYSWSMKGVSIQETWERATHVFHQVRAPLPAIISAGIITRMGGWRFIEQSLPSVWHLNPIIRAMRYWLFWNEMCEENAQWTYLLEEPQALCTEVSKISGRVIVPQPDIETNCNTRRGRIPYPTWTVKDLEREDRGLYWRIQEKALKYGYGEDLLYH